ncbi:MAG: sensor histidine kinase [Flavisolibacter sp.]|jgi:signal transduction histidine kinase
MRISYLIFLSFLFILLLFAITTYINFRQSEKVRENSDFVVLSTSIVKNGNRFQRNILNMGSGLRGFLLTGDDYFLQAYDSAAQENDVILKELFTQVHDTSEQTVLLKEIKELNDRWLTDFARPLRQAKIGAEASDRNLPYFNKLYREKMQISDERKLNTDLQKKIREFINLEYERRSKREDLLAFSVQKTKSVSFTLTTFSVIMALFVVSFLIYRISNRITKMVKMADSITGGNYEVHTEETGRDELSGLARSLNYMAKTLSFTISELKRKNTELDQFAHIVSHDMKAPLRGIDNVVSWIEEDHKQELSPKVADYLQLIKGRVVRGENLIQGLLSYARIGKDENHKEELNIHSLVEEVMENFAVKPGTNISISPLLPVIYSEKLPLLQIFSNLIGNAIKYNDKEEGEISVYHKEYADQWEFFVKDNGPGIGKSYHEKIFLIFQTLQERDSFESTGVGLAIVRKILDSRNEKIFVSSEPGKGSLFSFTWKK